MHKLIMLIILLYPLSSLNRIKKNSINKTVLTNTKIRNNVAHSMHTLTTTKKHNNDIHFIGPWKEGFFVSFHSVLNHIAWSERHNKIPVVYWDRRCIYFVPEGFNNEYDNVWEYYFEPVASINPTPPEILQQTYKPWHHEPNDFEFCLMDQGTRDRAFKLITKYIKLKPVVQQKIDDFYRANMQGKKTIGIHLRGTDKGSEEMLVSPEEIVTYALKHADSTTQFLLASDEERLIHKMKDLLKGRKVICYDCYRSKNGHAIHKGIHQQSRAQAGEDVLIEVILLSKSDLFVHTLSYVSTSALYFNPHLEHILVRNKDTSRYTIKL